MPTEMTMGQLLVREALPEALRGDHRILDKKGISGLLRDLGREDPEEYRKVSKRLSDIGRTVAQRSGGYSFGLDHMAESPAAKQIKAKLQARLDKLLDDDRDDPRMGEAVVRLVGDAMEKMHADVYDESVRSKNPLARQVLSGARGNKMNLSSLRGSDLLYSDQRDRPIPLPVMRSYSQGLTPAEYWAATYGARKGVIAVKMATADAGYFSKQLNQAAHRLVVTDTDGDGEADETRGLPVDADDPDNEGALLARTAGGYPRNTVLTPKVLGAIRTAGLKRILVRSPIVGGPPEGGLYARDVGVREFGDLPGRGEFIGNTAAQAIGEPISQGQLSAKHSGGVSGQEKAVSGFAYINQIVQVPKRFKGGATHSEADGVVQRVEKAPAGGHYVFIDGKEHHVPLGAEVKVKPGDRIEAGDSLSSGIPNPAVVVEHKGGGEGARYLAHALREAMRDGGLKADRRNTEVMARALVNHVRMTDHWGDHIADDVVPYSSIEANWEPREGFESMAPSSALGKHLERPVLHYTIGTKVRPSVIRELGEFGIDKIDVHRDPPPFAPEMVRAAANLQHDPDWMSRMYGSGLKGSLLDAVHRGHVSDESGTSFVPSLARAVDFGRTGVIRQSERPKPKPVTGASSSQPQQPAALPSLPKPPEPPKPFSPMFKTSGAGRVERPLGAGGYSSGSGAGPTRLPGPLPGPSPASGGSSPPAAPRPPNMQVQPGNLGTAGFRSSRNNMLAGPMGGMAIQGLGALGGTGLQAAAAPWLANANAAATLTAGRGGFYSAPNDEPELQGPGEFGVDRGILSNRTPGAGGDIPGGGGGVPGQGGSGQPGGMGVGHLVAGAGAGAVGLGALGRAYMASRARPPAVPPVGAPSPSMAPTTLFRPGGAPTPPAPRGPGLLSRAVPAARVVSRFLPAIDPAVAAWETAQGRGGQLADSTAGAYQRAFGGIADMMTGQAPNGGGLAGWGGTAMDLAATAAAPLAPASNVNLIARQGPQLIGETGGLVGDRVAASATTPTPRQLSDQREQLARGLAPAVDSAPGDPSLDPIRQQRNALVHRQETIRAYRDAENSNWLSRVSPFTHSQGTLNPAAYWRWLQQQEYGDPGE